MGCKILKRVTWLWAHPFRGWLDVSRLGLAIVNLQTKFVVSNYTHCEDMRSGAKCTNWGRLGELRGHSRSSAMLPFDRAHTTSYSTLIETMYLVLILRYSRLFVEIRRFWPTPPAFGAHVGGDWLRWNFAEIFGVRKLESLGYREVLFVWSYV